MTRPVRIDIVDGGYRVMSGGFERGVVFGDDRDCEHFLELLEEMVSRYGVTCPVVGHAVRRIECRRQTDRKLNRLLVRLERSLVDEALAESPAAGVEAGPPLAETGGLGGFLEGRVPPRPFFRGFCKSLRCCFTTKNAKNSKKEGYTIEYLH
jgi:hypothetical protein